ncbi:H-NS histone family protein [Pseudoxanthomonas sp. F37]|nr:MULTISPECIES: H-NS histone family protein [Pseudoxanthomonas]UOV06560.1 H-NS histone family protein [Pseudoxanthomonas mexicana]UOV08169.1 H-NS histone family protein [Pseudoxanthomonas sp. F37]
MSIDLRNLSAKELGALIEKAKQQQSRLAKRTPIATVRSKITKFAKAEGYTLEELFGMSGHRGAKAGAKPSPRAGRKLGKVAPKYRNPANPKETWSGRGKHPRWMAALIAKGKKADDFLIKKK